MDYAHWFFWMRLPTDPKAEKPVSNYDTLMQVVKSGGSPAYIVNQPRLPDGCEYVWRCFSEIAEPSYSEIKAYVELTGQILDGWEVDAVVMLNSIKNNPLEPKWLIEQR